VVGQAGSSLSRAIEQATDLLLATPSGSDKALVLMSDGEGFEGIEDVEAAAHRAEKNDITIITVGFGRTSGSTIIVPGPGGPAPKRDAENKVVITRYTPEMLEKAAGNNGTFIPAPATDKAARIRNALSSLRAAGREAQRATDRRARFQLFLIPAVLLALIDTMLAERRGRRIAAPAAATTAVAALVLLMFMPAAARAQGSAADKLYNAGRYKEAAELYQRDVHDRAPSPRLEFNLGTSLLEAGQMEDAASALERAISTSKDLDLRYRALYNLGLVYLRQARAARAGDDAGQAYSAAADAYRRALRLRPWEMDAKWNYELANQERHNSGDRSRPSNAPPKPSQSIDPQQAKQLLNSAQREEREAQARKQRQNAPDRPPGGKDW
jgi:Ca-activated chloride channel family protein